MPTSIQTPAYTAFRSYLLVKDKIEPITGHLHSGQEHILFDLARAAPDGDILEVGCYKGRSTASMGLAILGAAKHIHSIDTFRGLHDNTDDNSANFFMGEFLKNMDDCGLINTVTPMVGYSSDFWNVWDRPLSMLFVDGNHEDSVVRGDVAAFAKWVVPGGIIAMHDVYDLQPGDGTGPAGAWNDILPELFDTEIHWNLVWGRKRLE